MAALGIPTIPRRLAAFGLLLTAVALFAPTDARPQSPDGVRTFYQRDTTWKITFDRRNSSWARSVELFVSRDHERDWQFVTRANPNDGFFPPYTPPDDGPYWFAVRGVDVQGQPYPRSLTDLKADYKIVLDRKPPAVSLRQGSERHPDYPQAIKVEWSVRDENVDLSRFYLDYQMPGSDWQPMRLYGVPQMTGNQWYGQLPAGTVMKVRLRAFDKAGNMGEAAISAGPTGDGRPVESSPSGTFVSGASTPRDIHYVGSSQVSFTYEMPKIPDSKLSAFELWYTKNEGKTWAPAPKKEGTTAPGTMPATPGAPIAGAGTLVFDADGQGLYGFRIVARNGIGIGKEDPKPGDQPEHWVMVDTEKPTVRLKVQPGPGYDVRNVRIDWSASDANLSDKPVSIQYAAVKDNATAPTETDWKPIEGHDGAMEKKGEFTWTIGPNGPFRFHVRAKVVDKAGNTNADQTREPVLVDLEPPQINIKSIGPGGK